MHSIVHQASSSIAGSGRALYLPEIAAARLRDRLAALAGSAELLVAVRSLIALAAHVELDRGAVACADALLAVAASAADALAALGERNDAERLHSVTARRQSFARFTDRRSPARAPSFGARAAAGSVRAAVAQIPTVFR